MSPRARFIVRRIALTIPTLIAMSIFVFLLIHLVPGDPARTILGFRATPENIAIVRQGLHLDESLPVQYWDWVTGVLQGDLGRDYISGAPVSELISEKLPVTLELVVLSMLLGLAVGVPLGVLAARGNRVTRRLASGFVVGGVAIPDFWLATLLVLVFAATLGWLPPTGWVPLSESVTENLRFIALPVLALAVGQAAYILRTTQGTMEEALREPFIGFLRARGVSERRIVFRHALRNAAMPIVTVVGIQLGVMLGAAVVIETIFNLPGLGRLVVSSINQRNYTVVQGSVLTIATIFILVTLVTDLLYGWLDPRVAGGRR